MEEIVLASSSPRRRQLLEQAGIAFTVFVPGGEENLPKGTAPEEAVRMLAERKASAAEPYGAGRTVVAADTLVAKDGIVFGKPKDAADAARMLASLSGSVHEVLTGVCIIFRDGTRERFVEKTDVEFYELSADEIAGYVSGEEPFDKAGAYAIQGRGALFVRRISGDYNNVVGLPVARLERLLRDRERKI